MYRHHYVPEDRMWTVGHYDPDGTYHGVSDHESEEEAAERVAFLNGGKLALMDEDIDVLAEALVDRMPVMFQVVSVGNEQLVQQLNAHKVLMAELVTAWEDIHPENLGTTTATDYARWLAAMAQACALVHGS